MKILQPSGWPRPKGYSNGIVVRGTYVVLSGIVGWNEAETFETDDFAGQAAQIFRNIAALLKEAEARPEHLVRLTWYVTNRDEYLASLNAVGAAYREIIGRHYPAMAVVEVSGLIEREAKLEIEATAIIPDR